MKERKENETACGGFTLVELVVVIAILGILAGVAYPAYTGYIKRAKDAEVISKLSNVIVTVESSMAIEGITDNLNEISIAVDTSSKKTGKMLYTLSGSTTDVKEITNLGNLVELAPDVFDATGLIQIDLNGTSFAEKGYIVWKSTNQQWESSGEGLTASS